MCLALRQVYLAVRQRFDDVGIPFLYIRRHELCGGALKGLRSESTISEARVESRGFQFSSLVLLDERLQQDGPVYDSGNYTVIRRETASVAGPAGARYLLLLTKLEPPQ